jgi:alcohol dehydrogenase
VPEVIALPRFARIGAGAIDQTAAVVVQLGLQRPLLVTDSYLTEIGAAERVLAGLRAAGTHPASFSGTVADPTTASLDAALEKAREHRPDCVIGLGGGSPMDTAKALAVLAVQGGRMRDYRAPANCTGPALPIIAIPTTAGSGSEATQFTIITDADSDEKMLCAGGSFQPVAAIVDFELTLSMPPRLTADTGVDALTHAIEAYVSKRANPFTDGLALTAIHTVAANLRRAYMDGGDRRAREAMMIASMHAGMAFSNSSVALVHGMSRPIGAHFHVAHGLSNAMLVAAVTSFSITGAAQRYADCARAYGVADTHTSDANAAKSLVTALIDLCAELTVPTPCSYGIDEQEWNAHIPVMAKQALASGSPQNNPVVPTHAQIEALYAAVYR